MGCFEAQPSPVQFNTVADDVNKAEPLPVKGFPDAFLKMVEVINGCPCIKVGRLPGEESAQTKG
jgi:hypothetical protein